MHLTQSGVLILSERLLLDQGSIILLLSDVAIYALWMYLTALATNMLAMRLGSTAGFAIIYTLQALMLSLLMIWESRILSAAEPILSAEDFRLLWMNPIAHLVLGWHSSAMNSVDGYIRKLQLPFDLSNSILIFIGMSVLITWVSWKIVQEQELINTLER